MPDSEIPKTGIIPVGGTTAGPLHDRSAGGLIGTLIAFGIIHYSGTDPSQGQAAAVYGSTATLGTMIGAALPEGARSWVQAILGVLAAVVGAGVLSGCTAQQGGLPPRDLMRDCRIAAVVFSGVQPLLVAKCQQAKDPAKDGYCLANIAGATAIAACFAAAERGAVQDVDAALAGARDAQAIAP